MSDNEENVSDRHWVTVDKIEKETDKAVMIRDGYGEKLWLPKSVVEVQHSLADKLAVGIPHWFWEKEELDKRFAES